ncbi:hypothetical protein COCNU_scaffold003871G000010 [Cocos nucifera]|nr:hypothetical protein [Cocos nucifera]
MDGIGGLDGGGANEGALEAPAFRPAAAAGRLPKMLAFQGATMASLAISTLMNPPKNLSGYQLLSTAYYLADFVLFLFGVGLIVLSVPVARNPDNRAMITKALMWGTLAPLPLLLAVGALVNPNMGF